MKLKNVLVLLILLIPAFSVFAQTSVDDVINDYFKALGGRDKLAAVNFVTINGTMEVMGGSSPSKITILNGKGYKSEMNFNGQDILQGISDKGGWMVNPLMGSPDATSLPQDQYNAVKDEVFIGGSLFNYKNNGSALNLIGTENIDGKSAYKIESLKDSVSTVFYIDSTTHFLDEKIVTAAGQSTTIKYSNYKKTDAGIMMAYNEEITIPQGITINYSISKLDFTTPVDPSIFNMPAKQ
jgi:hypothetical protein